MVLENNSAYRYDNWANAIAGLGSALRDKVQHTEFTPSGVLSDDELEAMYRDDDIAARVCDLIPDEMLRQGFQVQINDSESVDIQAKLEQLGAREKFNEALVWSRVFGGAGIFLGVDDGQPQNQPLNLATSRSLRFLTVLQKRDLILSNAYRNPLEAKFGHTETYRIDNQEIHESRLLIFHGTRTSRRACLQNGGWPHSVLQRMYNVMRQFNIGWDATAHLMMDSAQAVFKLKGLHAQIAANKTSDILKRLELVGMSRSVTNAILLDAEDEDFKRDSYQFAGIPDVLDKFMLRLAAAARLPVSLLMGQAPAGLNATGDADIRFFYDQIKAQQEHVLRPQLERLVRVLLACKDGPGPANGEQLPFTVTFPALWQESERGKAELQKIQADIDAVYIQHGVLLPEEVALNRFGAAGYNTETIIELSDREAILASKNENDDTANDDVTEQLMPPVASTDAYAQLRTDKTLPEAD